MKKTALVTSTISAVDLFCGVGGLTYGLKKGGVPVVAGIDIDSNCRYPYEKNNSAKFLERDVSSVRAKEVLELFGHTNIKLLAGCAPCQPFSTYSRSGRNSKYETQWPLLLEFGRLIKEVKPQLVTMENVPQLIHHNVFDEFVACLNGYTIWWSVVECTAYGIPQSRKRLVLMASRFGDKYLELPERDGRHKTVRQTIGKLPPIVAGEYYENDPIHTSPSLSEINLTRIRASTPGGTWRDWPQGLQASCHKKSSGATYPSVYGRMEWDKCAPTMTTQCFGYGNGRFGHPEQDRAISLREAAMLQTFPRNYRFVNRKEDIRYSTLGKLIGNAVPVRLGEIIAKSLVKHVSAYI